MFKYGTERESTDYLVIGTSIILLCNQIKIENSVLNIK